MCICDLGVESTIHYFLHCCQYALHRRNLLDKVSDIVDNDITQPPDDHLCDLLLFRSSTYNERVNEMILKCTVEFVKQTKRFQWVLVVVLCIWWIESYGFGLLWWRIHSSLYFVLYCEFFSSCIVLSLRVALPSHQRRAELPLSWICTWGVVLKTLKILARQHDGVGSIWHWRVRHIARSPQWQIWLQYYLCVV